ncbi:MAG: MBL fold metallo-hydrolase [Clostridia bacterium]|nr:MBL fold metallo-hydrolase [Clostridia bacterium]
MKVLFLGSTPCIHDPGDDAPAFLLNHEVLIDCGWNALDSMIQLGEDPGRLKYLIFTHLHHDHYMGLPALLFYIVQTGIFPLSKLVIAGPEKDLERVVGYAMTFLQIDTFYPGTKGPTLLPLKPGDRFETETLYCEVGESRHPVPAHAYRLTDKRDGAILGVAGDTVVHADSEPFFSGNGTSPCDALIHDSACGYTCSTPIAERHYGHSTLPEAAVLAENCRIPVLYPMHMTIQRAREAAVRYHNEHPESPVTVTPVRR